MANRHGPGCLPISTRGNRWPTPRKRGTPLIADPGFDLSRAAAEAGHAVTSAPGASAILTALTLAGLPTDAFFFAGFLPNSKSQRKSALLALKDIPGTLVFYESPKRVADMLRDAAEVLGADRAAATCRELTKKFEECRRGTLSELAEAARQDKPRGEFVVLIDRKRSADVNEADLESELRKALETMTVRDASGRGLRRAGGAAPQGLSAGAETRRVGMELGAGARRRATGHTSYHAGEAAEARIARDYERRGYRVARSAAGAANPARST